jgi:predicted alpha/beta-hydrolase family hydrolase
VAPAPLPPQGLRDDFGVRAQVLALLVHDDTTIGWVSCHSTRERAWSDNDVAAAVRAAAELVARRGDLERLAAARFGV